MEKEIVQTPSQSDESSRPQEVEQARRALQELEQMTDTLVRVAGLRPEHRRWLEQVQQRWQRCDRGMAALMLVTGPMDELDDGSSNSAKRRHALASAVVEAALIDQSLQGPWDAQILRQTLLQWLALGSWYASDETALKRIGLMIEQDSQTARDALAVRLGLLSSFWASFALWLGHSQ